MLHLVTSPARFASALLLLAAAVAAPAQSRIESTLAQMDAASARFQSAQADVRQQLYTAVIADTDTQFGSIYFERSAAGVQMGMKMSAPDSPAGSPAAQIVQFRQNRLSIYTVGTNQLKEFASTGKNQALAETFMTLGFGGSGRDLARAWTISDQGAEQIADGGRQVAVEKLDLVSKDPALRNTFTHITIWVDPARDVSLKQESFAPGGDTRTVFYTDIRLNQKIDAEAYAIRCRGRCSD